MKTLLRKAIALVALVAAFCPLTAATVTSLTSPMSGITVDVDVTSQIPYLIVKNAEGKQMAKVRLGLTLTGANYSTGMVFESATDPVVITDAYNILHGKCSVSQCGADCLLHRAMAHSMVSGSCWRSSRR